MCPSLISLRVAVPLSEFPDFTARIAWPINLPCQHSGFSKIKSTVVLLFSGPEEISENRIALDRHLRTAPLCVCGLATDVLMLLSMNTASCLEHVVEQNLTKFFPEFSGQGEANSHNNHRMSTRSKRKADANLDPTLLGQVLNSEVRK